MSKELVVRPDKPVERVSFDLTADEVNPRRWFFQKAVVRVSKVNTVSGKSDIQILHDLYEEARKCPIEAFCFIIWSSTSPMDSVIKSITSEEFLILLDHLCPRHHYNYNYHEGSFYCVRVKKGSVAILNKYEPDLECWVVSLLRSIAQLAGTWKEINEPATEKRTNLLKPKPNQFTQKCSEEQVRPVCDFLTKLHSYYGTIVDAKRAEKAVKERKRQLSKQQELSSASKIQAVEPSEKQGHPTNLLSNGHGKLSSGHDQPTTTSAELIAEKQS